MRVVRTFKNNFLNTFKILESIEIYFEYSIFWTKIEKNPKFRDSHFVERLILTHLCFLFTFYETLHSRRVQSFAVFLPKMVKQDVTNTLFSQ